MGIQGAVVVTPTVTSNTLTPETATMPEAGLTIVKIYHSGAYVSIPIDSTRTAIFPSAGAVPGGAAAGAVFGTGRLVTFTANGTLVNFSVLSYTTTPRIIFYYGSPSGKSPPLASFAGIVTQVTLSSGAGSGTWTFPSGNLTLVGLTATVGLAAASLLVQISWSTSSGQSMYSGIAAAQLTQHDSNSDIMETNLQVSQTVAFTLAGGVGSDVVEIYAFYR